MKLSKLEEIILTFLFALLLGIITKKFMDKYSNIIGILAILGILLILGKNIIEAYLKKNKADLGTMLPSEILVKDSQKVQGMINSHGATQIINQVNGTINSQLLKQKRLEQCMSEYDKVHIYQIIDTYTDWTDEEKGNFYHEVVCAKTAGAPKTNKYKGIT